VLLGTVADSARFRMVCGIGDVHLATCSGRVIHASSTSSFGTSKNVTRAAEMQAWQAVYPNLGMRAHSLAGPA
jgi:hypothetical protein